MKLEKTVILKDRFPRFPGIQGGMGVGISLYELASNVSREGWMGTISSAALDQLTARRLGVKRMGLVEATEREIYDTKKDGGFAAINIMCALPLSYEASVEGAIKGGVDMIISGAGLPTELPSQVKKITGTNDHNILLVPILSSARAGKLLIKRFWDKQNYRPDAIVLEGPKAGGHIGWSYKQVSEAGDKFLEEYDLFKVLLPEMLDLANEFPNDYGSIPVFVAGGIFTHEDIEYALSQEAAGVQMGTRFAATHESGAIDQFKKLYVESKLEDVVLASEEWGSPCGYPFRYLKTSPLAQIEHEGNHFCICSTLKASAGFDAPALGTREFPKECPEGYVLTGKGPCPARGYANYNGLYTCGTEVHRVKEIVHVKDLIAELNG